MKGYLLDTGILLDLHKETAERTSSVSSWFETVDDTFLFTSVLVIGEIQRGIEITRKQDAQHAEALDRWLQGLTLHFADRILPVTADIAAQWGRFCANQKMPDIDGLLAATALLKDLTLITRNPDDFAWSGISVINPFKSAR